MSIRVPRWAGCVFLLAFLARAAFVVVQIRWGLLDISFEASDSEIYRSLAQSMRRGRYAFADQPTAYVTPGYPAFLAALSVIGRSTLTVGLAQSVVGAVTAVGAADLARRVRGVRAAWAAGLLAAGYPHLIFWTGYVLTETVYTGALVGALWVTVRVIEARGHWGRALIAGAAWGVAGLVRPIALGSGLCLLAAALAFKVSRRKGLVALLGFVVVLAPWVVRNAATLGAPVLTSTEAGVVLWQGNSPGATGGTRGYVDGLDFDPLPHLDDRSEVERDRAYRDAAWDWMRAHPARVAALAPRKLWNMWRPTYEGASALNWAMTLATYPVLLAAGTAGLWLSRASLAGRLVGVILAHHLLAHALLTGMIRFRVPLEMVLTIPAGVALATLVHRGTASLRFSVKIPPGVGYARPRNG